MKTPRSGATADRRRPYKTQKKIAAQGILERTTPSKYSRAVWNKTLVAIMTGLFSLLSSEAVVPPPDGSHDNGNTAEGTEALSSNTTGQANTAIGVGALYKNTTGVGNTAIGMAALGSNTIGFSQPETTTSHWAIQPANFSPRAIIISISVTMWSVLRARATPSGSVIRLSPQPISGELLDKQPLEVLQFLWIQTES